MTNTKTKTAGLESTTAQAQKQKQVEPSPCFDTVQVVVAVSTGNRITNVTPQANLVLDLGLNLAIDLAEIVAVLNQEFKADGLDLDPAEVQAELEAGEGTAGELARIVQEVRELG
jgi:hypothetical protein